MPRKQRNTFWNSHHATKERGQARGTINGSKKSVYISDTPKSTHPPNSKKNSRLSENGGE